MLARLLNRSEPINYIGLIFLMSVWVFAYYLRLEEVLSIFSFLKILGVWVFCLMLLFYYDFMFQKYRLTPSNLYAMFVFLLLIGVFSSVLSLSKVSLSSFFVLLSFNSLLSLRKKENTLSKLFDSGLLLGIAFLLFPKSLIFILLIYIGYLIYVKIIDKRMFIPFIGFIVPVFLTYSYLYFFDQIAQFKSLIEMNFSFGLNIGDDLKFSIPFILLGFVLMVLILKFLSVSTFSELEEEKNYKLIIAQLFLSGFIVLSHKMEIKSSIIFILFPSAILIGNSLGHIKKEWIKESLFYAVFLSALLIFFL